MGRFEMLSRLSGVHTERTAIGRFLTGQAASVTALRDSIDEATTAYSHASVEPRWLPQIALHVDARSTGQLKAEMARTVLAGYSGFNSVLLLWKLHFPS